MSVVRADLRVVTSNHSHSTTDNTGSDTVNKRFGGSCLVNLRVGNTIQSFNDSLNRVTNGCFLLHIRDVYQIRFSVLEVLNGSFYDLFCFLQCSTSAELNIIRIRHLSDRRSGDEFGMEAFA